MTEENLELIGLPADENLRRQILEQTKDAPTSFKWAKTLVEYVQVLESLYVRRGMTADQAFNMARDSVMELAEYRGGRVEYLPKGDELKTALEHAEIYRRAKAGNIEALAAEFKHSVIHIYRIIRTQQALHIKRIQTELPLGKVNP